MKTIEAWAVVSLVKKEKEMNLPRYDMEAVSYSGAWVKPHLSDDGDWVKTIDAIALWNRTEELEKRNAEFERQDVRRDEQCRIYEERIKKLTDELEKMNYTANYYRCTQQYCGMRRG